MKVLYTKKFNKDIDQITHDKKLKKNLLELIAMWDKVIESARQTHKDLKLGKPIPTIQDVLKNL